MNIFKAMAVKDLEEATRAIPVIDFAPAFRGRARAGSRPSPRRSGTPARPVGFFYLAGHGVPRRGGRRGLRGLARVPRAAARRRSCALKLNENNIGYLPVNQSIQRASTVHKATRPNYNESFFISHDRGRRSSRRAWPARRCAAATSGRRGTTRMRAAMVTLLQDARGGRGAHAARAGPRARHARRATSRPFFANEAHINLRFLHYPPQDIDDDEQFGQGPHTDNSFITILARDGRAGAGGAAAARRVAGPAADPGHLPGQPGQHDEAVVERPLPLDAARRC